MQLHDKSYGSFLIVREVTEQLLFTAETGPHMIFLRQGKLTPFKQREFWSLLAWILLSNLRLLALEWSSVLSF